jgi:phage terminase small subunit
MSLSAKQSDFLEYYADIASDTHNNATQSAIKAGYSVKTAYSQGQRLLKHVEVKAKMLDYKVKMAKRADIDRKYLTEQANTILATSDNERNKLTALSLLADLVGAKRDNAPNAEKEAAKAKRMSAEDREIAAAVAKIRTKELSKPSIKLRKDA